MKILYICEPGSPHAARWINQFAESGFDMHIISEDARSGTICQDLKCGTVYLAKETKVPVGVKLVTTNVESVQQLVETLVYLIDSIKPDLIHTLGMYANSSNRCNILTTLRENIPAIKPYPWLYSSWGMDLECFAQLESERNMVAKTASQVNYHLSEGDRDIKLFKEFGFQGEVVGKLPAFGGTTWDIESNPPTEDRKTILIKARDEEDGDVIGRAFKVFPALLANIDLLSEYKIVAMQAGPRFQEFASNLSSFYGLEIKCPPRVDLQADVLQYFKSARAWISLTTNDGLPSSLVEAMSLGAVPIHSKLSSIEEWFIDEKHGFLIDMQKSSDISSILRKVLKDDKLVSSIASYNQNFVRANWSDEVVKPQALSIYEYIVSKQNNS